eukprot:SAG11_NODE_5714_length_1481_cov_0.903039_2_plen_118_part_00
MVVWLNVDAYMCPWRYSLLHALQSDVPILFSFYDLKLAQAVQSLVVERFAQSFGEAAVAGGLGSASSGGGEGESERVVCDKMASKLYAFKWLAHKAAQNYTNATAHVKPNAIDVFLP